MTTAHPFVAHPHRTLIGLSVPVLFSLVAEPVTGLVDTAFVARLGAEPLAALGVGTIALSSIFWIFNFLSIGTQTSVAQHLGRGERGAAADTTGVALALAGVFSVLVIAVGWLLIPAAASAMEASGAVFDHAVSYMRVRLWGAPAVLVTIVCFGALRGVQDMRSPLWVALLINGLNVALDYPLIFGFGGMEGFGVAGAAAASAISQWVGALWAVWLVYRRLGRPGRFQLGGALAMLRIGGDLFVRTGSLTLFLLLGTRAATKIGAEAGAAHQAIRQVWMFTALFLDTFAITGQSLIGYFLGAGSREQTRRVAVVVCQWSLGTGVVLGAAMLLSTAVVKQVFVPESAFAVFGTAWLIAAVSQPLNALSFGTDGIHWGTGDYRYLRNAMIVATAIGAVAIYLIDERGPDALTLVWLATALWILIRAVLGLVRIWPGSGVWRERPT